MKVILKIAFIAIVTFAICYFTKANEIQIKTYLSVITFGVLMLTVCVNSLRTRNKEYKTLINLILIIIPFIICYITNNVSFLFIPSFLLIVYFDVIGNFKIYKKKIYMEEKKKLERKMRHNIRRKESQKYNRAIDNAYHIKNGRQLYKVEM